MQTNEQLILTALRQEWITPLAFYYKAKATFTNSCFYAHTLRNTAKKLNVSYGTLRNNLKVLEQKGLIRTHSGNIIFVAHKDTTTEKHKCTININKNDSLKKIKNVLRLKILEYYARHQLKAIKDKTDCRLTINRMKNPDAIISKKELKKVDSTRNVRSINPKVTFTNVKLAKLLFCSTGKVIEFKKAVADKIKIIRHRPEKLFPYFEQAFYCGYDLLVKTYGKGLFFYRGWVFKSLPTEYEMQIVKVVNKNINTIVKPK